MEIKNAPPVKIKFEKDCDHKIHPVSGIWGGATPQGDIICHFFVEHQELPDLVELKFDLESGKTVDKNPPGESIYIREVLTSLLMRPDIAISVGKWLISRAEAIQKSKQQKSQEVKRTIQ